MKNAERTSAHKAEFDAVEATKKLAGELQGYFAESPAQHMEKINEQSAPMRKAAEGFVHDVLSEGMKQGAELKKGAESLAKAGLNYKKDFPIESTLAGVGTVGAIGCGAVVLATTTPEIVGLGTLGVVGFGGIAVYNTAAPAVKTFFEGATKKYSEATTARPVW